MLRARLLMLSLLAGCSGGSTNLPDAGTDAGRQKTVDAVPPTAALVGKVRKLQEEIPGASVAYSIHSGTVSRVDSAGLNALNRVPGQLGAPLVEGRGAGAANEMSALMEFMLRHADLYGITDPMEELRQPVAPINHIGQITQDQFSNADLPMIQGLRVRTLIQTFKGVPVAGRDVVGLFDDQGGLHSVGTRMRPVEPGFSVTAIIDSEMIWNQQLRLEASVKTPSLEWLNTTKGIVIEHAEELSIAFFDSSGRSDDLRLNTTPRLVYRIEVRSELGQALIIADANTNAVLAAFDTLASGWQETGTQEVASAMDETGTRTAIFPSTLFEGNHYLAHVQRGANPPWLGSGQYVAVADARVDGGLVPIQIPGERNGQLNNWNTDPTYSGSIRQSGVLLTNIETAMDYWNTRRGWFGWDGRGSAFWGRVLVRPDGVLATTLNAWGGGGFISIGDGTTPSGQFIGSSQEIVGHEITHSVIDATARLEYRDESGAINEALADFFGVAVTANRNTDNYVNNTIGDDATFGIRNMQDPSSQGQPEMYSEYVSPAVDGGSYDNGGVHSNSGIINNAHTLMVQGGVFNGTRVARAGLARIEQIVWAAMRYGMYPKQASMQEYASGVVSMCKLTADFNYRLGDNSYGETCVSMRLGFHAVQLMSAGFSKLRVEAASPSHGALIAALLHERVGDYADAVPRTKFIVTDLVSGDTHTLTPSKMLGEATNAPITGLGSGERGTMTLELPAALKTAGPASRRYSMELVTEGLEETTETGKLLRTSSFVIGSDLVATDVAMADAGMYQSFKADIMNLQGTGVPAGITGKLFYRSRAHTPLVPFEGLVGTTAVAEAKPGDDSARAIDAVSTMQSPYVFNDGVTTVELANATPIPGRPGKFEVWFDAQGGLDALDDARQIYFLADANDAVDELDETNNLFCVNCRAPGQPVGQRGLLVRLAKGTDVATLLPSQYQAAAAKLPATYARVIEPQVIVRRTLFYKSL